jgi:hypothetical protein
MSDTKGTKETFEMLQLVLTIAKLVAKEMVGDGFQWTDVIKIVTSSEFQVKLAEALAGLSEVPEEIEDLGKAEGIDLAIFVLKSAREVLVELDIERAA